LVEQRGHLSPILGALVERARLGSTLDKAAHRAIANLDGHIVDGSFLWQGKGIDRLNARPGGVGKDLRDRDAGEKPADAGTNVGVLERAAALNLAVLADDGKRAGGRLGRRRSHESGLWADSEQEQQGER